MAVYLPSIITCDHCGRFTTGTTELHEEGADTQTLPGWEKTQDGPRSKYKCPVCVEEAKTGQSVKRVPQPPMSLPTIFVCHNAGCGKVGVGGSVHPALGSMAVLLPDGWGVESGIITAQGNASQRIVCDTCRSQKDEAPAPKTEEKPKEVPTLIIPGK